MCRWRWNSQDWEGGAYNETEDSSRGAITQWKTDNCWLVLTSLRLQWLYNVELEATIADKEVYITKLLKEKTQADEQKQIING